MTIGAHISGNNISGNPLYESLTLLAEKYRDDHLILFSETNLPKLKSNCTQVIISPKPKNKLLLFYWYSYKLPALLKRYSTDVFISDAGMLSLKSDVRPYLYFSNIYSERTNNRYFRKIFRSSLLKAERLIVTEDFIADDLREIFKIPAGKISCAFHGLTESPVILSDEETQAVKEKYTEGCDYYLYPVGNGSEKHLVVLLKAFSQLKKWQKSSMKLVLLLQQSIPEEVLIPDFKNYKYRADVKIIKEELQNIYPLIQSSYALIFFSSYDTQNHAFMALQNNVPVIAADNKINRKLFDKGAIFSEVSQSSLAEKMQLLYKDELLKNTAIHNGMLLTEKYNADTVSEVMRGIIGNN